jgi:hypothetical protein
VDWLLLSKSVHVRRITLGKLDVGMPSTYSPSPCLSTYVCVELSPVIVSVRTKIFTEAAKCYPFLDQEHVLSRRPVRLADLVKLVSAAGKEVITSIALSSSKHSVKIHLQYPKRTIATTGTVFYEPMSKP